LKVLITGATGFIGGHLAEALVEEGHEVRALARETSDTSKLKKLDIEVLRGDIRDAAVQRAIEKCDSVYHLAARTTKDHLSRREYYAHNLQGTKNVAEASRRCGVSRVVYASSVGIYGSLCNSSINENTPPNPDSYYRETKLAGEKEVLRLHREHKLPVVVARLGRIYGPGSLSWIDLCRKIAIGNFRIIGTAENYDHMIYIDDLIEGLRRCGEVKDIEGRTYILNGSEPVQLERMLKMIAHELGVNSSLSRLPATPFRTYHRFNQFIFQSFRIQLPRALYYSLFFSNHLYDTSKAQKELNYYPKVSLKDGFRRLIKWYRESGLLSTIK